MSFHIERLPEEGSNRSGIYHRIADKPNGVTVKTTDFPAGATVLPEGTLLKKGSNGLYDPIATVKVVEVAAADAVAYSIAKGSYLAVGDKLVKSSTVSVNITAIDTSDADKDVVTVDATLGAKAVGAILTESVSAAPVGITGEAVPVKKGQNCFVSLWVIAVVNSNIIPEPAVKPALVAYV